MRASILSCLVVVACTATDPTAAPVTTRGGVVTEIGLAVSSLPEATRWFGTVTGAEPLDAPTLGGAWGQPVAGAVAVGDARVVLVDFAGDHGPAPAVSNTPSFQHLALVVGDIDARWLALRGASAAISQGVQQIPASNPDAGGIRAAYFRGPDDHPLELIWYPEGKGAEQWHRAGDRVLGIDHTAIVVAQTDRSLRFYRDLLGLPVRGHSLNEGETQARLSGVPGARVRITGLGAEGVGVELLEYLEPGLVTDPAPPGAAPFCFTTIAIGDLDAVLAQLADHGGTPLSSEVGTCLGCSAPARAYFVADPDGHAIQLTQAL